MRKVASHRSIGILIRVLTVTVEELLSEGVPLSEKQSYPEIQWQIFKVSRIVHPKKASQPSRYKYSKAQPQDKSTTVFNLRIAFECSLHRSLLHTSSVSGNKLKLLFLQISTLMMVELRGTLA